MRAKDPEIPGDEPLYRALLPDWVDGDLVLHLAIEFPATSFNRGKYSHPSAVLVGRPSFTAIAVVTPAQLPGPFARPSDGVMYHFYAEDLPEPANEAHAEVRARQVDKDFNPRDRSNAKEAAKELLARRLRIFTASKPPV